MTRSPAAYPLKLPHSLKEAAARCAARDGVSLNQWFAMAIAEKVGSVETVADLLNGAGADATGRADPAAAMLALLEQAGNARPADWDR